MVDALQRALAIEHQVIYGYGVLGAHLRQGSTSHGFTPTQSDARSRLQEHQELRDRLAAQVRAAGRTPVAAEPAYRLPFAVSNESTAQRLGRQLESSVAAAGYDVIAVSRPSSPERGLMLGALTAAAAWQARWALAAFEPYAEPFPGRPGQAG